MSNQSIADVELDELETDSPASQEAAPSNREEQSSAQGEEVVKQEEASIDASNSSDEQPESASPVEESRNKPDGDWVPRTRLNEEIFKKKKLREELDERKRSDGGQSSQAAEVPAQRQPTRPYPKSSDPDIDFDDDKLAAAQGKWHSDEVATQVAAIETNRAQKTLASEMKQTVEGFNSRLKEYAEKNPEYVEDYSNAGDPTWPPHINNLVVKSKMGPELDHHLLKNEEDRNRVLSMAPDDAVFELGQIASRLSNVQPKAKAQPKQTKAPAPISSTQGGGGSKGPDILDGYDIE